MRSRQSLAATSGAPGPFHHTKMLLLSALAFNTPAAHAQSSSVEIPGSVLEFGGRVVDQQLATQSFIGQAPGISVKENAHEIRIELEPMSYSTLTKQRSGPRRRRPFTRLPTSSELMEQVRYV